MNFKKKIIVSGLLGPQTWPELTYLWLNKKYTWLGAMASEVLLVWWGRYTIDE